MAIGAVLLNIFSCLCCNSCISKTFKTTNHQSLMLTYLFIFFVYYGFGVIIFFTFSEILLKHFNFVIGCPEDEDEAKGCYASAIIFRVAAALFVFFLIITICMLPKDDFAYRVNRHGWLLKWIFPLLLIIIFCFIPNNLFEIFGEVSKYLGIFYLVAQNLSFGEFFFRWSNYWIDKENTCYNVLLGVCSCIAGGATIVLVVFNFILHFKTACILNIIMLILNVFILLIFVVLSLLRTRNDVNVLVTSLYSLYTTYFFFSGMCSDTKQGCSDVYEHVGYVLVDLAFNVLLIFVIFAFLSFTRSLPFLKYKEEKLTEEDKRRIRTDLAPELRYQRAIDNGTEGSTDALAKLEYRTWKYFWLFLVLCLLVLYFMNVVTNWGSIRLFDSEWYYSSNQVGYFVKLSNAVICSLYYIYVLTIPLVFRNRHFGKPESKDNKVEPYQTTPYGGNSGGGKTETKSGGFKYGDSGKGNQLPAINQKKVGVYN